MFHDHNTQRIRKVTARRYPVGWPVTSANTFGLCAAIRQVEFEQQLVGNSLHYLRGSSEPSCELDVEGRAESETGQIGISYARKAGSLAKLINGADRPAS